MWQKPISATSLYSEQLNPKEQTITHCSALLLTVICNIDNIKLFQ